MLSSPAIVLGNPATRAKRRAGRSITTVARLHQRRPLPRRRAGPRLPGVGRHRLGRGARAPLSGPRRRDGGGEGHHAPLRPRRRSLRDHLARPSARRASDGQGGRDLTDDDRGSLPDATTRPEPDARAAARSRSSGRTAPARPCRRASCARAAARRRLCGSDSRDGRRSRRPTSRSPAWRRSAATRSTSPSPTATRAGSTRGPTCASSPASPPRPDAGLFRETRRDEGWTRSARARRRSTATCSSSAAARPGPWRPTRPRSRTRRRE